MGTKLPGINFNKEYFLFLLPVFFAVHGYREQYRQVSLSDIIYLGAILLVASIVMAAVFLLVFRNWRKAAMFSFGLMVFHIFFGPVHDAIKSVGGSTFFSKYSFILPLSLLLLAALFFYLKRTRHTFHQFTRYINLLLLVLIIVDLVPLVLKASVQNNNAAVIPAGMQSCDTCSKPDIYLIIADEYAGHAALKEALGFDNTDFEMALKNRGFEIIDSSISNYNYTPFSIASTFAMDYLQGIEGRNQSAEDRKTCYRLINENTVVNFLKAQGYAVKNYSVFQFNNDLPPVGSTTFFTSGRDLITAHTFLGRLDRDVRFNTVTKLGWKSEMNRMANHELRNVQSLFEQTKNEAARKEKDPRLIYTHLMMPHYPYFFDKNGKRNPLELLTEGNQWREQKYIEYLQYSNGKFLELVDHIFAHSEKPPVIILMGDHGFRHFNRPVDKKYHFMNFNAVYLPDRDYDRFYKGISGVNQFRVLLNQVFGQQLPLLKDTSLFLKE
jgi:hypothetical protein